MSQRHVLRRVLKMCSSGLSYRCVLRVGPRDVLRCKPAIVHQACATSMIISKFYRYVQTCVTGMSRMNSEGMSTGVFQGFTGVFQGCVLRYVLEACSPYLIPYGMSQRCVHRCVLEVFPQARCHTGVSHRCVLRYVLKVCSQA